VAAGEGAVGPRVDLLPFCCRSAWDLSRPAEQADSAVLAQLRESSRVERGELIGLAVASDVGAAIVGRSLSQPIVLGPGEMAAGLRQLDDQFRPRWVVWSQQTAATLIRHSTTRLSACWDVAAAHRMLAGGWRAEPARAWALSHDLPLDRIPGNAPADLFSQHDDTASKGPIRADGYLDASWVEGGWAKGLDRLLTWAELALDVAETQRIQLAAIDDRAVATARSESTAELLCAELAADGLPIDLPTAEALIAAAAGVRPRSAAHSFEIRAERDHEVLRHWPFDVAIDLRNPAQVKSMLRAIGFDLPDTRAWRLDELRGRHPLIDALLLWRKAERISTTYGYTWLDANVGKDGRLRGDWSGSDGAAGRMTATVGLHNMPAQLRSAVAAEPGWVFVRADLGQIEPRVLAAVSGDRAFAAAAVGSDLYAPVAEQLGVDRATAKVAVLGAMYGQTTGHGAQALRRLRQTYPVAMKYLDDADLAGQGGRDLRTYGGRLIQLGAAGVDESASDGRSRAAARGRYARNALVQGAAAELFKVWAVTVRARTQAFGGRIVLCLHDELLVHAPAEHADAVALLLDECLAEAVHRWAPQTSVRFIADTNIIPRWSDAAH
jgi:DNA polymerase I